MAAEVRVLETERAACIADVIACLEAALEQAETGRVIAVGVVVVRPDLAVSTAYSQTDSLPTLLGGVTLLSAKLVAAQS